MQKAGLYERQVKAASAGLISLFAANKNFIMADLWTFTLKNGTVLRYTSWDNDLTVSGNLFKSHDVILVGGKLKQVRGLEVNETELTCYPNLGATPSLVGAIPFLQACVNGLLDRATAQRERIFMPTPGNVSLGTVRIFLGEVVELEITRNTANLKCKDVINLLNIYMPRRQFQPTCPWTFGDSNCTFNKASLSVNGAATAGSSQTSILCGLAQVAGYFNFGDVLFTDGLNANVRRAVKSYAPGIVTLTGPLPEAVAAGDQFTITPGCSKNYAGPTQVFQAAVNNGSTAGYIVNNNGAGGGTYTGFTMQFTSGILSGLSRTISQWIPGAAILAAPFTTAPAIGDAFNILSGATVVASGSVSSPLSSNVIPVGLSNASGFFNGGTIMFTSGGLVGQTQTISSWANGTATTAAAFGGVPAIGDACTLTSAPGSTQSTCSGYSNTANFGGEPFVPIPETAY